MAVQSLTAMESKYNEPSEGDNGSGAGLVSRARIPLTLNPRKKGFTRIPPTLADTTSRPAGHASRRRTHWRNEQGADARNKTHKKKSTKNMKDNQQTHLKGTSQSLHYTTQRTHARLFLERGAAFLPSFPQPSEEYTIHFQGRVFLFHTAAMVFYEVCLPPVLSSRVFVVLKWPNNLLPFN